MGGKTAILSVRILGDAKGAVEAMGKAEGRAGKLGGVLKGLGGIALGAATVAGGALIGLGVAGVKAAGDLEQSIGAVDSVFKGSADEVHAFANSAATDLGLTGNEYRELATLMGTQLKNGGTSLEDLGGKTHELMGLGADLSSMFGGSTVDAVSAISSALKGERDPIEQFGVSLKQAGIDARAAELGFTKVGGALSDEAQQAATLSLIMDQTADAHGNFGRETGTFAGQVSILTAQWGNFTAQVGMLLLPLLTTLLTFITGSIMPGLQSFADVVGPGISAAFGQVVPFITGFISSLGGVAGAGAPLQAMFAAILPSIMTFGASLSGLLPMITGMVLAMLPHLMSIGAAVLGIIPTLMSVASTILPLIIGAVTTIFPLIAQAAGTIIPAVIGIVQSLLPILANIAGAVIPAVVGAVQTLIPTILQIVPPIVSIVQSIIGLLGPAIQWLLPIVTGIFSAIVTQIQGAIQIVVAVLSSVAALLRGDFAGAWEAIKGVVAGAITFVQGIIQQGMAIISGITGQSVEQVKNTFKNGFALVVSTVTGKVTELIGKVKAIPGQITDALGNLGSLLLGSGKALMDGFTQGIKDGVGNAIGAAGDAVSAVRDFFPFSPAKRGPFSGSGYTDRSGKALVGDFAKAMTSEISTVTRAAGKVATAGTFEGGFSLNGPAGAGGRAQSAAPQQVHIHIEGAFVGDRIGLAREIERLLNDRRLLIGAS